MKKHNLIFLIAGALCVSLTAYGFINMQDEVAGKKCQEPSECCTKEVAEMSCKSAERDTKAALEATTQGIAESATASLTNDLWPSSPSKVDFEYRITSRFVNAKDKNELRDATSILDLIELPKSHQIQNYWNIEISEFSESGKKVLKAKGEDENLTSAQKELLASIDYTSDFVINGDFTRKYESGVFSEDTLVYYLSVAPTTWATYSEGDTELINYLIENTKEEVGVVRREKLESGKIEFLITKEGNVEQVGVLSTSGYASLDEKFVALIKEMPAKWQPAKNAQGEVVVQKMVFYYGMMGC